MLRWPDAVTPGAAWMELAPQLRWTLHRGETDPILGWYSRGLGHRTPAYTLLGSGNVAAGDAAHEPPAVSGYRQNGKTDRHPLSGINGARRFSCEGHKELTSGGRMSGQALDLRGSAQIVRRYRILVLAVALVGLLLGAGWAVLHPPVKSSNALIVLPVSSHEIATQVVIAGSEPVLSSAVPSISPHTTITDLRQHVKIKSLTGNLISVTATGSTAAQAEATANAVSDSFISYLSSGISAVGHVQAKLVAPANSANGSSLPIRMAILAVLGAIFGALRGGRGRPGPGPR